MNSTFFRRVLLNLKQLHWKIALAAWIYST